jgi:hypothetical protein
MKHLLFPAALLLSIACAAQRPVTGFTLTAGTDFNRVMTHMGLEYGLYTANRAHSIVATLEADRIDNRDLPAYGRVNLVHPGVTTHRQSEAIGAKYVGRMLKARPVSLGGVVHPWYSMSMHIFSADFGSRIWFTHKGDNVGIELVHDPFAGRYTVKLVFTAIFKK